MSDHIEDYRNMPDQGAEAPPGADTLLDAEAGSSQPVQIPAEEMEDGLDEFQEEVQEKPKRRPRRRRGEAEKSAVPVSAECRQTAMYLT